MTVPTPAPGQDPPLLPPRRSWGQRLVITSGVIVAVVAVVAEHFGLTVEQLGMLRSDQLAALDTEDVRALAEAGAEIRAMVEAQPFPADLEKAIRDEFAKLSGAKTIVMDMNEQRLAFVRDTMGVPDTILTKGDGEELKRLAELTNGQLADVVVDATGSNKSMGHALNYCAFKGRLVYVGITQSEISFLQAPALHRRELDIRASRNALPGDFTRIIRLIEDGQIDTRPWITHQAGFEDMIGVFPSWTQPETGVIKAVVAVT